MDHRLLWLLGIFGVSVLLGGGVWVWSEFIAADRSPTIQTVILEPATLRFVGGTLSVEAEVTDDVLVERVSALLKSNDAQITRAIMELGDNTAERSIYSATFSIPANTRNGGQLVEYTVQVRAVDNTGQETMKELVIQVPAPSVPPAPPHRFPTD